MPIVFLIIVMAVAGTAGRADGAHAGWALWWFSWWLIPIGIFTARRLLRGDPAERSGGAQDGR